MNVPGESLVSSKIHGLEPQPTRVTPGSAVRPSAGASTAPGGETAAGDDDVFLTSAARKLAAVEESVRAMPVVDDLRVAAVKQRLEDGRYKIDPQRIADRLLRLEADLARATPFDSPLK